MKLKSQKPEKENQIILIMLPLKNIVIPLTVFVLKVIIFYLFLAYLLQAKLSNLQKIEGKALALDKTPPQQW